MSMRPAETHIKRRKSKKVDGNIIQVWEHTSLADTIVINIPPSRLITYYGTPGAEDDDINQ